MNKIQEIKEIITEHVGNHMSDKIMFDLEVLGLIRAETPAVCRIRIHAMIRQQLRIENLLQREVSVYFKNPFAYKYKRYCYNKISHYPGS